MFHVEQFKIMSKTLKASLIWKIKLSEYNGNAHFFGELCEHLDWASFEISGIEAKDILGTGCKKVSADVTISYNLLSEIQNEDAACAYILNHLKTTTLPESYIVLVDVDQSEFNPTTL
jgi:hypothetical protein